MLNLASTSLGPRFTLIFRGGGEESFIHEFGFPPPQSFFLNETGPRAKPRGHIFQYFYFDTCIEANTHIKDYVCPQRLHVAKFIADLV
jgi:hypothetical protein